MKLKDINETFSQREITPSKNGWDNLQKQMDSGKKRSRILPLLITIASAAAILMIALTVLSPEVQIAPDSQITNTTNEDILPSSDTDQSEVTPALGTGSEKDRVVVNKDSNNKVNENDLAIESIEESGEAFALSERKYTHIETSPFTKDLIVGTDIDTSNPELRTKMTFKVIPPTEDEAEVLLAEALKNTATVNRASVNPDFLLQETEWNLEADKSQTLEESIRAGLKVVTDRVAVISGIKE